VETLGNLRWFCGKVGILLKIAQNSARINFSLLRYEARTPKYKSPLQQLSRWYTVFENTEETVPYRVKETQVEIKVI
jgi:hypothetical protein